MFILNSLCSINQQINQFGDTFYENSMHVTVTMGRATGGYIKILNLEHMLGSLLIITTFAATFFYIKFRKDEFVRDLHVAVAPLTALVNISCLYLMTLIFKNSLAASDFQRMNY